MKTEGGQQRPRGDLSKSKAIAALIAQYSVLTLALSAMVFALALPAEAQQPTQVPRIGFLTLNSSSTFSAGDEAFRQGLISVGYIEGKNIVIEWRYAERNFDRLREMAAELLRLKVNAIVTGGPSTTRLVKQVTSTLPIIMATDPDPVGNGFVASLARPGGNITGLSSLSPEISGKQLELLKDVVPRLSRLAVFGNTTSPGNAQRLKEVKLAAGALKVQLQYLDVQVSKDVELAFRTASKGRAEAVLQLSSSLFNSRRAEILELAVKNRFPAIYPGQNLSKPVVS